MSLPSQRYQSIPNIMWKPISNDKFSLPHMSFVGLKGVSLLIPRLGELYSKSGPGFQPPNFNSHMFWVFIPQLRPCTIFELAELMSKFYTRIRDGSAYKVQNAWYVYKWVLVAIGVSEHRTELLTEHIFWNTFMITFTLSVSQTRGRYEQDLWSSNGL